jgi:RecA-family ATPase
VPDDLAAALSVEFGLPDGEEPAPLWVDSDDWSERDIPPRAWVAPQFLLRGAVSVLSGAPGTSKSALVASWATAVALGQPFGGFAPRERGRAIVVNAEDDAIEQRRRLSAVLRAAGAVPRDLAGRLVRVGPVALATMIEKGALTGALCPTAALDQLEQLIVEHKPDVVCLDPRVELHTAEENDNGALRAVMATFRSIAVRHNVAVLIVHHSKKGTATSVGDPDTLRGASSIVGAARIVLTVTGMTLDEAKNFGLSAAQARHYFRVDGAKANYS